MHRCFGMIAAVLLICASAQAQISPAGQKLPFDQFTQVRIDSILDKLQDTNDWNAAASDIQKLFDQAVLYTPTDHPDALREADFALRLITQLQTLPQEKRIGMLKFLRSSPDVAWDLLFLMPFRHDSAGALS